MGIDKTLEDIRTCFPIVDFGNNNFSYFSEKATFSWMTELGNKFCRPRSIVYLELNVLPDETTPVVEVVEEESKQKEDQNDKVKACDYETIAGTSFLLEVSLLELLARDQQEPEKYL
ncbi:hypothetical protein ACH5RR_023719 [Cinchona calisaya]|uniref:Uncharacterized protein n=1 Tax=Cinchona calisaya TaxID=153742 RepID=A0ABD2ZEL4_9GENT